MSVWGGAGAAGLVIGILLGGVRQQPSGGGRCSSSTSCWPGAAIIFAFGLIGADRTRDVERRFDCGGYSETLHR